MPRVPTYDNLQSTPSVQPQVRMDAVAAPDVAGREAQNFGQGLSNLGNQASRIALDAQNEANTIRVQDAVNQAKEASMKLTYDKESGFMSLEGINALQRDSGESLTDEYGGKLRESFSSIADSLGNDAQRRMFDQQANNLMSSFRAQVTQHETTQYKNYALSVQEGTIKNQVDTIGLNYQNPQAVDEALNGIGAAVYQQSRLLGKSAEWADAQAKAQQSQGLRVALSAALQDGNVTYANDFLAKYSSRMNSDDILRARGLITKQVDSQVAMNVTAQVMHQYSPQLNPSDADRAFNIALNTESGNRQFDAQGNTVTSQAGALGKAQVMPTTGPEAAKLAGLPWDENRLKTDANYNEALGRAYFQKQLQTFGGDLGKAYAAYNAGPGATSNAVAKAQSEGQPQNWLAYLPAETQNYVTKNLNAFSAGQGKDKKPTLLELHNAVREKLGATSPERLKMALDETTRQYTEMNAAIKQRDEEATAGAMQALVANGGRFSELPLQIRSQIPVENLGKVMDFAGKISKGTDTTNLAVYQKLASDPGYLKNLSDAQFYTLRNDLSEADFKKFANQRAAIANGTATNGPEELNTSAINQVLNNRLQTLGINPKPKTTDTSANMRIGAIQKFVHEQVLNQQQVTGKKMTDGETEKFIDGLFARSQTFRNTFLGIGMGSESMNLLGMSASDIPSDIKTQIKSDFKDHGISNPTDADLLGAYWHLKFANAQ